MKKLIVILFALFLMKPAHAETQKAYTHGANCIVGGLLNVACGIWAYNAGHRQRARTKDFCYTMSAVFFVSAVYRFGGGD